MTEKLQTKTPFESLAERVRAHIRDHREIKWGWDGDCASDILVDDLEEFLDKIDTTPILFREHRGSLEDSMKTCRVVENFQHLQEIVNEIYGEGNVSTRANVYDDRIGWDTQSVCLDGRQVGFTSAEFRYN